MSHLAAEQTDIDMTEELRLFAYAVNWKRYYGGAIRQWFGPRVLEVGAGIGETTRHLCSGEYREWLCLEPDTRYCEVIRGKTGSGELPACCSVINGTTESLQGRGLRFDTILYIDVLEHIADDRAELGRAARLLGNGGRVIVLAPAHEFLYSPFDKKIGHHRRYNRRSLRAACPAGLSIRRMRYLDSAGMLASLANRLLLSQTSPTTGQILMWDRVLVRLSRLTDPLTVHCLGKSILAVLAKT